MRKVISVLKVSLVAKTKHTYKKFKLIETIVNAML